MGFFQQMQSTNNIGTTENGAKAFATTLNKSLDFFAQAGAMRNWSEADILQSFYSAFAEDKLAAMKLLFYFRDIRGGQGERRLFRTIFHSLCKEYPQQVRHLILLIPEYGRWDDLYCTMDTPVESATWSMVGRQLTEDLRNYTHQRPISLLAKWLKSERTHGKTNALGLKTRKALKLTSKEYRKMLSAFRKHIDVVERKMSAGEWDSINFAAVPSQAMLRYNRAFDRNAPMFAQYLELVAEGKSKINSATLYPYQLVGQILDKCDYCYDYDNLDALSPAQRKTLDEQWKALPNYVPSDAGNTLVMADVSGSMEMAGNGLSAPINISVGLALYLAERMHGAFHNKFMTFSAEPDLVEIRGEDLVAKVKFIAKADWGGNTNLKAAMNLILRTAIAHNVPQADMPERLIIISDMQFDQGASTDYLAHELATEFAYYGYTMPSIVWWNAEATNSTFPMTAEEDGLIVSGASSRVVEAILSNRFITPYDLLQDVLDKPRYSAVQVAWNKV